MLHELQLNGLTLIRLFSIPLHLSQLINITLKLFDIGQTNDVNDKKVFAGHDATCHEAAEKSIGKL